MDPGSPPSHASGVRRRGSGAPGAVSSPTRWRSPADGPGATIGAYPDQSYPGKPTNLRWHRRPLLDPGDAKTRRSGSKSGSGRWSQWDEIGWVHYPEIGWSHSGEIRWVQSLEILHHSAVAHQRSATPVRHRLFLGRAGETNSPFL